LGWILKERWFWMLFVVYLVLFTVPILVAWILISLPPVFIVVVLVALIVVWIVVRGYRGRASQGKEREAEGTE